MKFTLNKPDRRSRPIAAIRGLRIAADAASPDAGGLRS